jgi:hypothetical protein
MSRLVLAPAVAAAAAAAASSDSSWYVCSGVSCGADAPWNGTETVPFLGIFATFTGCEAACEALPNCTTFCFGGSTPHVGPQKHDWHNRCYGRTDGVWSLRTMADEWAGCNPSRSSRCPAGGALPAAGDAVVVDVSSCLQRNGTCRTASQVGAGVLLSLNATHPRTEVIEPLKLHAHRGDWGVLPAVHERLTSLGITRSEPLLADLWCYKHGCDHGFSSLGDGQWPGDNGDWTEWEAFVKDTVQQSPVGVVFDIWNEPGQHGYFWNRNHSQYLEMWSRCVHVARETRPGVQVSGPSYSGFDLAWIHQFLKDTSAAGVAPDIVSWHEFSPLGRDIPSNVESIRSILRDLGLGERPISINEMVPGGENFNPAVHTSYFANLERADVDSACHSCWAEPVVNNQKTPCNALGGSDNHIWPGRGDNCGQWQTGNRQTLDGLVTCDGSDSPRGVWWAYKSYGSLQGTLLEVNASQTGDAVAVVAVDGRSVSLSVGRLQSSPAGQCTGGSSRVDGVTVLVHHISSALVGSDGMVEVAQAVIHNTGMLPLEQPIVHQFKVGLKDGAASITIAMNVSDAALVVLGPTAFATVKAFAVPPAAAAAQPPLKLDDEDAHAQASSPKVRWFSSAVVDQPSQLAFATSRHVDGVLPCCHFLKVDGNGELNSSSSAFWATGNFSVLREAGKQVIVDLGGDATACESVSSGSGCAMWENRVKLTADIAAFAQRHSIDGFTLDWEFGSSFDYLSWNRTMSFIAETLPQLSFEVCINSVVERADWATGGDPSGNPYFRPVPW